MSRRAWAPLVATVVALAAGSLAIAATKHAPAKLPSAPHGPLAQYDDRTFEGARELLSARTANAEMLAAGSPESANRHAEAAGYRLDYGQLTGDYEGYVAAERHLENAFAAVERRGVPTVATGTGPFLLKAQLDYTLHRFAAALGDLDAPERDAKATHDDALLAEIEALRGAATFARGDYDAGLALLREAERLDRNPSHGQRLALALAKVGEDTEAIGRLERAPASTPRARAWNLLQRALVDLEHGRRAEAREKLIAAQASFPGFWLVDEHLAELEEDLGHTAIARAAFASLVERTGDPEHMDALARLVESDSPQEAAKLTARANAIYEDRLRKLPEASYGHALEHMLRVSPDRARTVEIAEKNRAIRPDGEARTRLAQAYLRAGRGADAKREIEAVLATRWTSSETYATAAIVLEATNATAAAHAARAKADARNPYAFASLAWLVPEPKRAAR